MFGGRSFRWSSLGSPGGYEWLGYKDTQGFLILFAWLSIPLGITGAAAHAFVDARVSRASYRQPMLVVVDLGIPIAFSLAALAFFRTAN